MDVMLRDAAEADLPVLFAYHADPEAVRMAAVPPRDWPAFEVHWRERILGDPANRAQAILAGGAVAGSIVSWTRDGRRLVGYWVGREHWGRGVASAALAAFVTLETRRPLYAYVALANPASRRVLEKAGFRPVGEPETGDDGVTDQLMGLGAT